MEPVVFDRVAEQFEEFHARFAPLFGRKEARQRSEQYPSTSSGQVLRGLLVQDQERAAECKERRALFTTISASGDP